MKIIESEPKILRMFYSAKELAVMMDIGYDTFRAELRRNDVLYAKLTSMGWRNYKRLCKAHVLEIFKVLGYPEGYEHYELSQLQIEELKRTE